MEITLQCFGAFRSFGRQLSLPLPEGAITSDIRKVLAIKLYEIDKNFLEQGLIDKSRFATETEILPENQQLQDGATIAIIPPVAGG